MKRTWLPLLLAAALVLSACGVNPSKKVLPPITPAAQKTLSAPTEEGLTPQPTFDVNVLNDIPHRAVSDLAARLDLPIDSIQVVQAAQVSWPDSSLGCPQDGMSYSDLMTPGFLVILVANGQRYEYHSGVDGNMTYCEKPTPPSEGVQPDD